MTALSFLHNFAQAQQRLSMTTEREVHHHPSGERPVGEGWTMIEIDNSGYAVWERTRFVKAAGPWEAA